MACLDTSFIADIYRKNPSALSKLDELMKSGERFVSTVINVGELYKGAYGSKRKEEKIREIDELCQILPILEMDTRAAKYYGYYYQFLKKKGLIVGNRDLLIVCIALAFGERKIITRDVEHFLRIPGVSAISY